MFQQVSNLIKKTLIPVVINLSFLFHITSIASFDMHITAVCGHRAEPTGTGQAPNSRTARWQGGCTRALTKQRESIRETLHAQSHWNSQQLATSEEQPGQGRAGPRSDASPSISTRGGGDGRRMRSAALAAGRDGGAAGGPEAQVGGGAGRRGGGGAGRFPTPFSCLLSSLPSLPSPS